MRNYVNQELGEVMGQLYEQFEYMEKHPEIIDENETMLFYKVASEHLEEYYGMSPKEAIKLSSAMDINLIGSSLCKQDITNAAKDSVDLMMSLMSSLEKYDERLYAIFTEDPHFNLKLS